MCRIHLCVYVSIRVCVCVCVCVRARVTNYTTACILTLHLCTFKKPHPKTTSVMLSVVINVHDVFGDGIKDVSAIFLPV